MRNALTIVIGAVAGFALGYAACKRQLEQSYQDQANSEIADLKDYYEKRMKKEVSDAVGIAVQDYEAWLAEQELASEKKELEQATETIAKLDEQISIAEDVRESPVSPSTRAAARAIVDYTQMSKAQTRPTPAHAGAAADPDTPYQITAEEFFSSTSDNEQVTLTYYVQDDVLATQDDRPLEGEERAMIDGGLLKKYVPTTDGENVLYVRSPKLEQEFEIIRADSSFSKEVLGLGDDPAS